MFNHIVLCISEQSIFATEASGMLGLVTSKNKKKNKQPKESKADRRQKITKKWKAIADKSIQSGKLREKSLAWQMWI